MRYFINKKNKEFKEKVVNSLNSDKEFNLDLDVVENPKHINESYENMFNLQLMESCISIDEEYDSLEYDSLEYDNVSKIDIYTV